ncbi:MAG TPA: hypothetical protein VGK67_37185 [Myxococcales bacterium]|jgi:hypothetical protein
MAIAAALSLALALYGAAPSLEVAYLRALELERKIGQGGRPRDLASWAHELAKLARAAKDSKAVSGETEALRGFILRGAERTLSSFAVKMHNEGKKHRSAQLFLLANGAYEDYLPLFPEDRKAYDLRFFHAELLNDNLNRYEEAAEEYTRVLRQDIAKMEPAEGVDALGFQPGQPGRWMVNTAYNAVLAYDEVAKKEEKNEARSSSDPNVKLPIPKAKQDLLAACERYLKYVPPGPKYASVLNKTAYIYYRYNHFDQSTPRFARIALELPEADDQPGLVAANLILDTYALLGEWDQVNAWARRFLEDPKLSGGKMGEDLRKVLEQSALKLQPRQTR